MPAILLLPIDSNNRIHTGRLLVLIPRDGRLDLVASIDYDEPSGDFPPLYNAFTFMGRTDLSARTIQHHRRLFDSGGCRVTQVDFYEFNEEQGLYMPATPKRSFFRPDSFGCFLRQADLAMADARYTEAIDFFERAFTLAEETRDPDAEPWEDFAYYQARLVLAYLLTDQTEQAVSFIADIPEYEDTFFQAVVETFQREHNAVAVCQAVYDFVFTNPSGFYQIDRRDTIDGIFRGAFTGSPLYLNSVACNLEALVDEVLATHTFTTTQTPLEQLAALGLTAQDYLTEDMDGDGQAEWLVWISPGIEPIFFYPHNTEYMISRYPGFQDPMFRSHDLRAPDADNVYGFVTLPGDAGRALVNIDVGYDRYGQLWCGGCGGGGPQPYCEAGTGSPGDLTIWHLDGGELTTVYTNYHCTDTDIAALFPNGSTTELNAAATRYDADEDSIIIYPAVYTWDATTSSYELPPQPTSTPILAATPLPVVYIPPEERPVFPYQGVDNALAAGDMRVALEMADYAITRTTHEPTLLTYHYYRALALEALGRPDQALAEYVAIYEATPDSHLGTLAALHIQMVDGE